MLEYIILFASNEIVFEGFVRWNLGYRPSLIDVDRRSAQGILQCNRPWRLGGYPAVMTRGIECRYTIQGAPVVIAEVIDPSDNGATS